MDSSLVMGFWSCHEVKRILVRFSSLAWVRFCRTMVKWRCHHRLGLPSRLFPSGFPIKMCVADLFRAWHTPFFLLVIYSIEFIYSSRSSVFQDAIHHRYYCHGSVVFLSAPGEGQVIVWNEIASFCKEALLCKGQVDFWPYALLERSSQVEYIAPINWGAGSTVFGNLCLL